MSSHIQQLIDRQLITNAPSFLSGAIQYEVVMGSVAYGVSSDSSDFDIYGFAIAPKDDVFPHLRGEVPGFDLCKPRFEHYQEHHIIDASALGGRGREYDVCVYAIAKYFRLLMENNPNIIDSLFVPENCVLHCTPIGAMIRQRRQLFLHKGCWPKFKGYAYNQIKKTHTKAPLGKRKELVDKFGYDVKFAYHVVRLLNEVEQILIEQDLDLLRSREQLKAIRRGDWSLEQVEAFFNDKEKRLEQLYLQSELPATADTDGIRQLLLDCLEQYYGNLTNAVARQDQYGRAIDDIRQVLAKLDG